MIKRLIRTKTFWAAATVVIIAAEQIATGSASLIEAIQIASTAILALFLRDGIAKQTGDDTITQ